MFHYLSADVDAADLERASLVAWNKAGVLSPIRGNESRLLSLNEERPLEDCWC